MCLIQTRRLRYFFLLLIVPLWAPGVLAVPDTEEVSSEGISAETERQEQERLLASLPDGLRDKAETYLKQDARIEKEIQRMEALAQAGGSPWAQRRATGMATKLNSDLRRQRQLRQEIFREYRSLLLSGWRPDGDVEKLETLLFGSSLGS